MGMRSSQLQRALESVANSSYRPLQVVLVYQGASSEVALSLAQVLSGYSQFDALLIQNVTEKDDRSNNLNLGWSSATGRYVTFLDDDDTIAPRHIELLVSSIGRSGSVWAYGQSRLIVENEEGEISGCSFPFYRHRFSYTELLIENFIPIHSFLIDRAALDSSLTADPFYTRLRRSEDWDFLIRLAFFHPPSVIYKCICSYFVSKNGSNTNVSLVPGHLNIGKSAKPEDKFWIEDRAIVLERARDLIKSRNSSRKYENALTYSQSVPKLFRAIRRVKLLSFRFIYTLLYWVGLIK
tara:strand:- start:8177 stop:9061 length:885 start_codon:yes stop_codon:yes gene_type:complete